MTYGCCNRKAGRALASFMADKGVSYHAKHAWYANSSRVRTETSPMIRRGGMKPKISVTWYFPNGRRSHDREFETADSAFTALTDAAMDAMAFPSGTNKGTYNWDRTREHSFPAFAAKMALIADPPALEEWRRNVARQNRTARFLP
jgi:hypothetical protein